MRKIFSTTLLASSILAITSGNVHAEESNSVQPESFKKADNSTIQNETDVKQYLNQHAQDLVKDTSKTKNEAFNKNAFKQYEVANKNTDKTGVTHYTLKAKINDVTSSDSTLKVHVNKNGDVKLINGSIDKPYINVKNSNEITSAQAEKNAFKAIGKSKAEVENIKGYDIVSKNNLDINSNKQKLVYNIELNYVSPKVARWKIQVDATTGKIIKKQNTLQKATTEGKGTGVNGDVKSPLNITQSQNQYTLHDTSQNATIDTQTANNTTDTIAPITNDNTNFNKKSQRAGVDAHYYAKEVYDYYLDTFDRDSYNDKGGPINSIVNYDKNFNNAAWTGQYMIYGDGDGQTFKELSGAKDVVAHELTHAVTERTAGLEYSYQSGALNESFSDVFGYFVDPDNWLMGEDVYTPDQDGDALRSLKNPEDYNQPAHMDQYQKGSEDNGGVHANSGIPNKAAYLTITDIGKDKAEQIYYLALTEYLTPNAQFTDAKTALTIAADKLYGDNSEEGKAIEKAWDDVGVK